MLMRPQSEVPGIRTGHAAVWMVDGGPPLVAEESCREHLGVAPCDRRHPTAVHMSDFPGVSFDEVSFLTCSGHAGCLLRTQAATGKRTGFCWRTVQVTSAEDVLWTVSHWSITAHAVFALGRATAAELLNLMIGMEPCRLCTCMHAG